MMRLLKHYFSMVRQFESWWSKLISKSFVKTHKKKLMFVVIVTSYTLLRRAWDQARRKLYNYPPGNNGIPFFGSLLFMKQDSEHGHIYRNNYFDYLQNKYQSPITMINFGLKNCVVIHDFSVWQKICNKKEFLQHNFKISSKTSEQFVENGSIWQMRRNIGFQSFINLALSEKYMTNYGSKCYQNAIFPSLDALCERDTDACVSGACSKLRDCVMYGQFCVTFLSMFGDSDDLIRIPKRKSEEFQKFSTDLDTMMNAVVFSLTLNTTMPAFVAPLFNRILRVDEAASNLNSIVEKWINQYISNHKKLNKRQLNSNQNATISETGTTEIKDENIDVLDGENKDVNAKDANINSNISNVCAESMLNYVNNGTITLKNMLDDITGYFEGSIHTTTDVTCIALTMLAESDYIANKSNNIDINDTVLATPNLQEEIYQNVMQVTKSQLKNNIIDSKKRVKRSPMLKAFVHECVRVFISVSAPKSLDDNNITIEGYNIPKNSILFVSFAAINKNKRSWNNPNKFDLNNWLKWDKNGQCVFKNNKVFCGFGFGKRNCPGKALALNNLYIFFEMLIQRYKFTTNKICQRVDATTAKHVIIQRR